MCTLLKKHCVNPYTTVSFSKTSTTFVRYINSANYAINRTSFLYFANFIVATTVSIF